MKTTTSPKTKTLRMFSTKDAAWNWMRTINHARRAAGNTREMVVMVEGPAKGWAVMDLASAIDADLSYSWA